MALLPSDSFSFLADGWDESKETPRDSGGAGLGWGSLAAGRARGFGEAGWGPVKIWDGSKVKIQGRGEYVYVFI